MKARDAKGALSADLLVCFPSRTHLTLMPKSICSPARSLEARKHHNNQQIIKRGRTKSFGQVNSPMLWAKTKAMGSEISEPTSPKVTCAGQIKVRHKTGSIKSWQSVMEEIERIHKNKKHKKPKPNWAEALGFKKDVMHFLTCLRRIRFDFRCFGSFPQPDITSDDEDEEEEEEEESREENHADVEGSEGAEENSRTVFSKWYMALQENKGDGFCKQDSIEREDRPSLGDGRSASAIPSVPPPNALLLMRCRSAPAKTWLEEKEEEEENDHEEEEEEEQEKEECQEENKERKGKITLKSLMDEEKMKKTNENLVVMTYGSDIYNMSTEIAKETWVVGGMKDPISRSRSWKR